MQLRLLIISACFCALFGFDSSSKTYAQQLTPHLAFTEGAVNQVIIDEGGKHLAIYGAEPDRNRPIDRLLLTHHRRDAVWMAPALARAGTLVTAPAAEKNSFDHPEQFWQNYRSGRFHDYSCSSSKILIEPLKIDAFVKGGDRITWQSLNIEVLDTPGYTAGAVSYLITVDGKRVAFTGDLIVGDGQILDLFSFQDAIQAAEIRGYHGYGSRLAELVKSLRMLAEKSPDWIVPARGPVIKNPAEAIERLIARVQSLYQNYLSTTALHWYFKEDRMRKSGARILNSATDVELMPNAYHQKAPEWLVENATSRLIISEAGSGFLIDCGYQRVIDAMQKMIDDGVIQRIEGIFVTHYHDDHTDMVAAAAKQFNCPVYADTQVVDILERPEAYHMPAMTATPIPGVRPVQDGQLMRWHEFDLTFHHFPGQAIYHGAVHVRKSGERPIFFIGDSFAPSGLDDYCLLNRNLVGPGKGYNLCLEKLRSFKEPVWLVNEHIPYVFEFKDKELSYLEQRYAARIATMKQLFPWDSPNYGLDPEWATFFPYGVTTAPSRKLDLQLRIENHSPKQREFVVSLNLPTTMTCEAPKTTITIARGEFGIAKFSVNVGASEGDYVMTANVESESMNLQHWAEAMVHVAQ